MSHAPAAPDQTLPRHRSSMQNEEDLQRSVGAVVSAAPPRYLSPEHALIQQIEGQLSAVAGNSALLAGQSPSAAPAGPSVAPVGPGASDPDLESSTSSSTSSSTTYSTNSSASTNPGSLPSSNFSTSSRGGGVTIPLSPPAPPWEYTDFDARARAVEERMMGAPGQPATFPATGAPT